MNEQKYDKLLNIKTCGDQKIFNNSLHYHRYEPTSYESLNSLFDEYKFNENDSVVDFGCGKGRLNFYINHYFNSYVTGIEMNKYYYELCLSNIDSYNINKKNLDINKILFSNCMAQEYKIKPEHNKFYFFNPFSLQIFIKVIYNILDSVDEFSRVIDIILYYPSEDYIYYIENNTCFSLYKEIKLYPKYSTDERQKFSIYRLDYSSL